MISSSESTPTNRTGLRWILLPLVALVIAAPSALAQERAKLRAELGGVVEDIEKLDAKIERAEKALDKEKGALAKKHEDAFDLKEQKAVGAVLATLLEGQCGPDKPDRFQKARMTC